MNVSRTDLTSRRSFLSRSAMGLGALGLQELMQAESPDPTPKAIFGNQHHAAKAKRAPPRSWRGHWLPQPEHWGLHRL